MERDPLGPRLKQAREARGLSLREIATTTKISMVALQALEQGDFSQLPGGIYSRAFIRAYATEVGLDCEETVREFVGELSIQEREAARIRIRPAVSADDRAFLERQQQALRVFQIVAAVGGVALVILATWLIWTWWPAGASAEGLAPARSAPVVRQPVTPPPPADPVPTPSGPSSAVSDRLTVTFNVTGACWVQVTADGRVVLSRLMQTGEREVVAADRELVLDVGNAGAFAWTINGRPGQMLGAEGRRRKVTVTRENARTFLR